MRSPCRRLTGTKGVWETGPTTRGGAWRFVMSDRAGNDERLAFLYDSSKLTLLEEVGEVAFPPKDNATVALAGITQAFAGFDRNPYVRLRETSLCSATSTCRRPTRP